jgi:hypothetical protein
MKDILVDNKPLYNLQYKTVTILSYIFKFGFFLYITGLLTYKPPFLLQINFCLKILVALFLIYRFNSHRNHQIRFTELDRKVASSAGLYILVVSFADIIDQYTEEIRSFIIKYNIFL